MKYTTQLIMTTVDTIAAYVATRRVRALLSRLAINTIETMKMPVAPMLMM
ncbi:MAG TPA: hypothetical protein VGZ02_11335 [Candidatus Baltobacteraceae bacterium]|jgi:hypothetical protein|nr:hypothetical protein [Candidatus Baltobacteraceae bacterium]